MKAIVTALILSTTLPGGPATADAGETIGFAASSPSGETRMAALPQGRVNTEAIERVILGEGFVEVSQVDLRRGVYRVEAIRPNGAVFALTLDAQDGRLIGTERLGWARAAERGPPPLRRSGKEFRFDF